MVGQAVSNTNDAGRLAFGLRGCRDLLEKLRYETGSLNTTERHDVTGRAYSQSYAAGFGWRVTGSRI